MAETHIERAHIVLLPSPGMGHLIPFLEFAKHLLNHQDFDVTCIVPTIGSPPKAMKAALEALPPTINHIFLPPVDKFNTNNAAELLFLAITRSLPSLRDALSSLISSGARLVALLVDPFGFDAFDVAKEFHIPPYVFFPSNAMALSFCFYFPKLDELVSGEFRDLSEPVQIPGCVPVHGRDLIDPVQDRKSEAYKLFSNDIKRIGLAKGVVVNTFQDLEAGALKAMMEEEPGNRPSIYSVGPLIRSFSSDPVNGSESDYDCLRWLDNQPSGSVLFVSFGSGGTISQAQINELAFGLEMNGQRFIWVVRGPNEESKDGAFFSLQSQQDPSEFLPKGFMERTKERGLVIPSWAPQAQILSHRSIGGFLTHCGWNSILESIVNGVPMIAWPLYAEQRMNAVMLTEDVKVALRPKPDQSGLIMREEISNVVNNFMEGEEGMRIRNRIKQVQGAAQLALKEDGSSTLALAKLAREWISY